MCFYHDYDWTADVYEEYEAAKGDAAKCDECHKKIHPWEWRRWITMQENEECGCCGVNYYDRDDYPCEDEDGHSYGESYEGYRCQRCETLIAAIAAVEEAEGCVGEETKPLIGMLYQSVGDGEGWGHYADRFLSLGLTDAVRLAPVDYDDFEETELIEEYAGYWCTETGFGEDLDWEHGGSD